MLGINRQSKYVEAGFNNRALYESYMNLEVEIQIGEKVSCWASPESVFTGIDDEGVVTVHLLPFGTKKTCPFRAAARLLRCEP